MILKVTEQNGITIVEFVDVTRFTLASADEVKTELRPLLNNKDCRMLFDFHDIEFVDSSAIGCIIALFKTAKSVGSSLKLCNLTPEVLKIFELLHLQVIFDITGTRESCMADYVKDKASLPGGFIFIKPSSDKRYLMQLFHSSCITCPSYPITT